MYGHMDRPYDELIHVPLIMKFPKGDAPKDVSIPKNCRLIDVVPTIVVYLNIELSLQIRDQLAGESLMSLIQDGSEGYVCEHIITEKAVPRSGEKGEGIDPDSIQASIRTDKWKLILDRFNNKNELYNLKDDPREQIDLIADQSAVAVELETMLSNHLKEMMESSTKMGGYGFEESEEVKRRLRDLGYID